MPDGKKEFKEKYYVEINPDTEIVRVGNKSDLKTLSNLNEIQGELPDNTKQAELPSPFELGENEVCGHWNRVPICISEIDYDLYKQIASDVIVGGYCPDCNETFSKNVWVR